MREKCTHCKGDLGIDKIFPIETQGRNWKKELLVSCLPCGRRYVLSSEDRDNANVTVIQVY